MSSGPSLSDQVLAHLVRLIRHSLGFEPEVLTPAEVDAFGGQDILDSSLKLGGQPVDSLAVAEVLVGLDEALGISLLDWIDDDQGPTPLNAVVSILVERAPEEKLEQWLNLPTPSSQ